VSLWAAFEVFSPGTMNERMYGSQVPLCQGTRLPRGGGELWSRISRLARPSGPKHISTAVIFHDAVYLLPVPFHGRHSNAGNAE